MAENGIELQTEYIKYADYPIESAYEKTRQILRLKNKPTAILTMSGLTTLGALKAIKDSGLSIPGDLSIVSFDDFESSELLNPPITAVAQPAALMAALKASGAAPKAPQTVSPAAAVVA